MKDNIFLKIQFHNFSPLCTSVFTSSSSFFKQMPQPVFLTMHMVEVNASNSLIPFQCSSTSNCRKFKRFSAFKINNVHMFQPFSRFKHKQHLQLSNAFHHSSTSHIHKFQSFSTFKQKPTFTALAAKPVTPSILSHPFKNSPRLLSRQPSNQI